MQLELKGQADFRNLNLRVERHGPDDRELGVDLKLTLHTDADALAQLSPTLRSMLYGDELALRMPNLKPLGFNIIFEHHTLHISDQSYDDVAISKVAVEPEPEGRVGITFNVSMSAADPGILPTLAVLLLEEVCNIIVEPMQAELPLGDAPQQKLDNLFATARAVNEAA